MIVPEISEDAQQNGVDFTSLPSPRFLRSHERYSPSFPNVIYLLRDGRDVLISYYHHFRKFHGYEGSLHEFISSDCRDVEWSEHVESWLFHNPPLVNLLLIRYEDMLASPEYEIKKIIDFSNFAVSDHQIEVAVKKSSFESMQEKEELSGLGYVKHGDSNIKFVRKGQAGEWKHVLNEDDLDIINKRFGETLKRLSYAE